MSGAVEVGVTVKGLGWGASVDSVRSLGVSPLGGLQGSALQGGAWGRPVCSSTSAPQGPGYCRLIIAPLSGRKEVTDGLAVLTLFQRRAKDCNFHPGLFTCRIP